MTPMERRVAATEATKAQFEGKPFAWGTSDCVRLATFHVRQFGWKVRLARAGGYTTALGAKRALTRAGFADLAAAIDGHGLPRIALARVLVGDLVQGEGDPEDNLGFGAIGVALGNGAVLGWHPDAPGGCVLRPSGLVAAWSVLG